MLEPYEWKKRIFFEPVKRSPIEELYYKVRCYYNAQTELYDRSLTDEREPWDNTSAFVHNGYVRKLSNEYAIYLYRFCKRVLIQELHTSFNYNMWTSINDNRCKAQYWINEYERMVSTGELDFIEKYKN